MFLGIGNFVLGVKCVTDIGAMSIHFSYKVVINAFLWLAFHSRMTNDCDMNELFGILSEKAIKNCAVEEF